MPFSRTNGVKDPCDSYVYDTSCNTENPPTIFTPTPRPTVDMLPATGLDHDFMTVLLLIGLAFIFAAACLGVVFALRARQAKQPSQILCSTHKENHWPNVIHHDSFVYYPFMEGRSGIDVSGMTPAIIQRRDHTFSVVDPLTPLEVRTIHKSWTDAVADAESRVYDV